MVRPSASVIRIFAVLLAFALLELMQRTHFGGVTTVTGPLTFVPLLVKEFIEQNAISELVSTFAKIITSFAIGTLIAMPMGIVFWRLPVLGRICEPYLVAAYTVPMVLFYPVALVVFGLGFKSVVAIGTVMAIAPVAINTWTGLAKVPDTLIKVSLIYRCTPWFSFRKIIFPAAAPLAFAGLKLAFVNSLIGVVATEFFTAGEGLGERVKYHYNNFDSPRMWGYVLLIIIIAGGLNALLLRLQQKLTP